MIHRKIAPNKLVIAIMCFITFGIADSVSHSAVGPGRDIVTSYIFEDYTQASMPQLQKHDLYVAEGFFGFPTMNARYLIDSANWTQFLQYIADHAIQVADNKNVRVAWARRTLIMAPTVHTQFKYVELDKNSLSNRLVNELIKSDQTPWDFPHAIDLQTAYLNNQEIPVVVMSNCQGNPASVCKVELGIRTGPNNWAITQLLDTTNLGILYKDVEMAVENTVVLGSKTTTGINVGVRFTTCPRQICGSPKLYVIHVDLKVGGSGITVANVSMNHNVEASGEIGTMSVGTHSATFVNGFTTNPRGVYHAHKTLGPAGQWQAPVFVAAGRYNDSVAVQVAAQNISMLSVSEYGSSINSNLRFHGYVNGARALQPILVASTPPATASKRSFFNEVGIDARLENNLSSFVVGGVKMTMHTPGNLRDYELFVRRLDNLVPTVSMTLHPITNTTDRIINPNIKLYKF